MCGAGGNGRRCCTTRLPFRRATALTVLVTVAIRVCRSSTVCGAVVLFSAIGILTACLCVILLLRHEAGQHPAELLQYRLQREGKEV
jgi:hypothetical protein